MLNKGIFLLFAFLVALTGSPAMAQDNLPAGAPSGGTIKVQERRDDPTGGTTTIKSTFPVADGTVPTTGPNGRVYIGFGKGPQHPEYCPTTTKDTTGVPDAVLASWGWKRIYPAEDILGTSWGKNRASKDYGWMSKNERWAVDGQGILRRLICGNEVTSERVVIQTREKVVIQTRERVVKEKEIVNKETIVFLSPNVPYPTAPMPGPHVARDVTRYYLTFNFPIEKKVEGAKTYINAGNNNGNGAGSTNSGNATGNGGAGGTGTGGTATGGTANGGDTTNQNNSGSSSNSTNAQNTTVGTGSGDVTGNSDAFGDAFTDAVQVHDQSAPTDSNNTIIVFPSE